jgi:hypothetical protein
MIQLVYKNTRNTLTKTSHQLAIIIIIDSSAVVPESTADDDGTKLDVVADIERGIVYDSYALHTYVYTYIRTCNIHTYIRTYVHVTYIRIYVHTYM